MKIWKSNIVRTLTLFGIAVPLMISLGCSPKTISLASIIGFGTGWITASQFTDVTVENRCYVNGEEVDCADVDIPD